MEFCIAFMMELIAHLMTTVWITPKKVSLEIKCPYNCENPYTDVLYNLTKMYVSQVKSQLFAFKSELGILATKSENSVIVKQLTNDEETWSDQSQILLDFYDNETLKKPTKFHSKKKNVQNKINFFADHNFTVLMEVPEVTAFDSNTTGRHADTPFCTRVHCESHPLIWEKFSSELSVILAKCFSGQIWPSKTLMDSR